MMQYSSRGGVTTEAAIDFGLVQLIHRVWPEPIDISGSASSHHLQLSLLPNTQISKACFVDHWGPHRYEPFGQMFLLPAEQMVHFKSDCSQQQSIVCRLAPHAVEQWLESKLEWSDQHLQSILNITDNRMRNLLFQIGEEIRKPAFGSDAMIELIAGQLAIELGRYLVGIEEREIKGGLSSWQMQLIEQRLYDDSAPPSLTELATLCAISVRHLSRAFRISRGRSIGSYIGEQRMNHAKRMLSSGISIKDTTRNTGFSTPSNFTAAFTRTTGETPRQYQARTLRQY